MKYDPLPPFLLEMDWTLLRAQKLELLKQVTQIQIRGEAPAAADLEGLVTMLDAMQDFMADEVLDPPAIFGKHAK